LDRGLDVPEAVLGDLTVLAGGEEVVDVGPGDPLCLGRGDAEGAAVEIEVELPCGTVASTDVVEGELLGEVTMGIGLVPVAEPVLPGDGNVQQGGPEVEEGHVEPASVEGDNLVVALGDVPERGEQFLLIDLGGELDPLR